MAKFNSVKTKLISVIFIIVLLSIGTVVFISSSMMSNTMKAEVNKQTTALNNALEETISISFESNISLLKTIASTKAVMSFDQERVDNLFTEVLKANQQFKNVYYATPDEASLFIRPQQQLPEDFDARQRPWFKNVVETGDISISDVYIDAGSNAPVITISLPVKNDAGELVAVMAGDVSLEYLSKFIQQYKNGETGYSYITDSKGVVIAHPNYEIVKKQEDMSRYEFTQQALAGKTGTANYEYDGIKKLVSYAQMPSSGWGLFSQVAEDEAYGQVAKLVNYSILVGVVVLILAVVVAFVFSNRLTKPIKLVAEGAQQLAEGDLKVVIAVDSKDEIGTLAKSFNTMAGSLRDVIETVVETAEQVAGSSASLNSNAEQISSGANETAANITEMASGISQVSNNSQEVAVSAERATSQATHGQDKMQEMTIKIGMVGQAAADISSSVKEINDRAQGIGKIVDLIKQIAEQTNLLALNAAIEAARAGEAGKGFAVVAEEVRKLAAQSGAAVKDIQQLISGIQTVTDVAVMNMQNGETAIAEAEQVSVDAAEMFDQIVAITSNLAEQIGEVAAASQQMSSGIQNVAAVTEEQTASIEETTAATNELASLAEKMKSVVAVFKI